MTFDHVLIPRNAVDSALDNPILFSGFSDCVPGESLQEVDDPGGSFPIGGDSRQDLDCSENVTLALSVLPDHHSLTGLEGSIRRHLYVDLCSVC